MKSKLHIRSVEAASPGFVWDTELTGFGLKVTPKGKKVFIVQTKGKRVTIGAYPAVGPQEARRQAKAILGQITLGTLPSPILSQPDESISCALDRFEAEHIKNLRQSTQVDYRRLIKNQIEPRLGRIGVRELDHDAVRSWHHSLKDTPYRANRALAVLSKLYSWLRISSPTTGVKKYRELRRVPPALPIERVLREAPPICRFLLLTGMRKGEVLGLRWEWIRVSEGTILLPDSKTGPKCLYLSPPAIEVLQVCGPKSEGLVFPKPNIRRQWKKLICKLGIPGLRMHDLRHHYATKAAQCLPISQVSGLLGHKDIRTTMRYVHVDSSLALAARVVGEKLTELS